MEEGREKEHTEGRAAPSVVRIDTRTPIGAVVGVHSKAVLERVGRSDSEDNWLAMALVGLDDSPLQAIHQLGSLVEKVDAP